MAGIVIGLVLLVAAAALLYFANRSKQRMEALTAAPTVPVKDLASVGNAVVEVVGTATSVGPQLTSPVGQRPCAWFELTVHEIVEERDTNAQGHTTTRRSERLKSRDTSPNPIGIDDGTGVAAVDLAALDIDQPVLSVDRRIDDDDNLIEDLLNSLVSDVDGLRQRERIIPVGQRVFAIGAATVGPEGARLAKPSEKGQPFMLSTRDEAQIRRSAASSARWMTIGGIVAAVAGVVALIAGALS